MKIRLWNDSLRIRLSQLEVARLGTGERIEGITHFGSGAIQCEVRPEGEGLDAGFANGVLTVRVNAQKAVEWSLNDYEGLYAMDGPCKVAIEKDFPCRHPSRDPEH